jgi:hypothetical protein
MALSEQQRILTIATVISEVIQQDIDECDVICHEFSQPLIAQQDILSEMVQVNSLGLKTISKGRLLGIRIHISTNILECLE